MNELVSEGCFTLSWGYFCIFQIYGYDIWKSESALYLKTDLDKDLIPVSQKHIKWGHQWSNTAYYYSAKK